MSEYNTNKLNKRRAGDFEVYSWSWIEDNFSEKKAEQHPSSNGGDISSESLNKFWLDAQVVANDLVDMLAKKQADYGPKSISSTPGGSLQGILVRVHDKISRAANLVFNNKQARNETILDTFFDIAGYCILAILVLQNKWGKYEEDSRNL